MSDKTVAIIGASGLVGRAVLELLNHKGEEVIGLARRKPGGLSAPFVSLDLMDQDSCFESARSKLANVTHIIYTALYEKPGLIKGWHEADQMETNLSMLQNILEPMSRSSRLRHITLLQGTKAYGAHIEPMKIPGLERKPRHTHQNFYWLQQDYLENFCGATDRTFTIWRPQIIFGHALNAPMNMLNAIGVYATIMKARGERLIYPGGPAPVAEAIDAELLARAIHFSLDNRNFKNETFNITNGDVFRWQDIWPDIAILFNMEPGGSSPKKLSEWIYHSEDEWRDIVVANNLEPYRIKEIAGDSFFYADALFNTNSETPAPPALVSTIKLRQAGFNECIDTLAMLEKWFNKLRALKIIPN